MSILFEDIFEVKNIDPEGKKFAKVSRLECQSENYEMQLLLDVNTDIYPMEINDKFSFALSSTLNEDGDLEEESFDQSKRSSLADHYEYVMYGKVFQYDDDPSSMRVSVYVSFGGLLMMLKGDVRNLQGVELDSHIYLLMRKT